MPANLRLWIERSACIFAILIIPFMVAMQALHLLPRYHAFGEPLYCLHFGLGLFLLVNVSGNLYYLIRLNPTTRGRLVSSTEVTPAWRFCHACECLCPPRSYHCEVCRTCVLKRDHHCLFAGNCVGLTNQRYYLLTVGYFAIAGTYAALFNWRFVLEELGGLSFKSAFQMLVPFVALCLGVSSPYEFALSLTQAICTIGGALLWILLALHLRLLLANQTTHERARKICDYDVGWRANVAQVFGPRAWLACVWPLTVSAPTVDGFSFPMAAGLASEDGPRKFM